MERTSDYVAGLWDELSLNEAQRVEVLRAYAESPGGTVRCAEDALRRGEEPVALLLTKLRAGEHRSEKGTGKWTGWRRIRGSHADSYARDPHGRDPLPEGYRGAA